MELLPQHHQVFYTGSNAIYTCYVQNAVELRWYYNETLLGYNSTTFSPTIGVGIINIQHVSEWHNNTVVHCEATFSSSEVIRSSGSIILVQGEQLYYRTETEYYFVFSIKYP